MKGFTSNWLKEIEQKHRGKHKATLADIPKKPKRVRKKAERSKLEESFLYVWTYGIDGPALVEEYRFCPDRKWRFDFAHVGSKVAVEIEGGVWSGGRHTRGGGYIADCAKYNRANALGWRVFRLTGDMITVPQLEEIKRSIGGVK